MSTNEIIDYQDFVKAMNWRDFPVPHPKKPEIDDQSDPRDFSLTTMQRQDYKVNYNALLDEIFGN